MKQSDFQTFVTRAKLFRVKSGAINQLHLTDAWDRVNRKQAFNNDVAPRLLTGFASRAVFGCFVFFQIARR